MDFIAVGKRIKEAREREGLTQEELAEYVDMSSAHISVIERGKKGLRLENLVRIANVLGVSPDELLQDVANQAQIGVINELTDQIMQLPPEQRARVVNAIKAMIE